MDLGDGAAAGTAEGGGVMERLTYRDKDGFPMMKKRGGFKQGGVERLAAYEDTGLTPQACAEAREAGKVLSSCDISFGRLAELLTAERAGRLVVLPCRIGATAYILIQDSAIFYPETNGWYIVEETIDAITQDGFYLGATEDGDFRPNDAIGKTVFLTREEAEKALEEMKDE